MRGLCYLQRRCYITILEHVSCVNPFYLSGLSSSDISICTMEETAPYRERPATASVNRPQSIWSCRREQRRITHGATQSRPAHRYVKEQALQEPKIAILIILPQQEPPTNDEKGESTADCFRPLARELKHLDDKDSILAAQATHLLALY